MVGFFDDLRLPAYGAEEEEPETPPWLGAPGDWLPGVVPVELVVARSEKAAVYLSRLAAYPVGCSLTVEAVTRERQDTTAFELMYSRRRGHETELPDELLRLGVQFADGRKATSLGGIWDGSTAVAFGVDDEDRDPAKEISLITGGGGGSDRHSTQELWLWPLPPPGPVTFVCEWPAMDIHEASVEVDAESMRAAADRAERIWPEA